MKVTLEKQEESVDYHLIRCINARKERRKMKLTTLTNNEEWLLKLAEWRNHKEVRPILLTPYVTAPDIEKQKEWANRVIWSEKEHFFFITTGKADEVNRYDELLGYCGLIKIENIARTAEMSLLINPAEARKGYGTEAVKQLLHVAFNELNLNCVYVQCYTTSKERWEFFKKQGFHEEGILRARKFWDGKYYDTIIGSILKEEW
jgi:RimJ/RimL family protein N-acetyltransferase